ncbi:alpha-amylase family glycosyl hydrolase [Capnocytophaga sp. oral taxon 323]|uniref:alpha-amylase family glycosyl hydrolase n=1 Tax=Capnocytophaga sp. oral taxon 323 TaxID=1705617 RepID=UPI0006ADAFF3|nr:alpha-amylase family glycosyl hydrolase [Capnocytophaga sp. oral taxon 323]ALC96514.1 alpha-amylase [Capnocytophaga sp. oral taxon 323]
MAVMNDNKIVVYQVLTRLFGNTNTTNKPWGTIEENGVGKFADFTTKALEELKALGVTHIWFTGVLHHALTTDYTAYGISNDFTAVVKGRAGSPYAIKDYYTVNPDLADDPTQRLEEWEALIARTHQCGLKVIMDIVPNHVARRYESIAKPEGTRGFGEDDDTTVQYAVNNNFYYNPNEAFQLPEGIYGEYHEFPAKWTGNGTRASKPDRNDWYETVKLNYGVRPDGTKDFAELPASFENEDTEAHYHFWADKTVPDTWRKFKDIALYWLGKGVDGFRYDMAEMVPVEFWSYLNSAIKHQNPKAFLLAEVYNPNEYRPYLHLGKMDYLYDKVQLYDTLRNIVTHGHSTDAIVAIQSSLADIAHRMLHFLENHDEQRIASPEFAGYAEKAKPAMTVSMFISESPVMLYFGQEVGEKAAEVAGFGSPSRTSIFDYIGVPAHQRWVNNKRFDGGQLSEAERSLRNFYQRLLNLKVNGAYIDLHQYNRQNTEYYNDRVYSFARGNEDEQWVIVSNFSEHDYFGFDLQLPDYLLGSWFLNDGTYTLIDALYNEKHTTLQIANGKGRLRVDIAPLESLIFKISKLVDS